MTGVGKNKKNSSESITEELKELQKLLHETRNNDNKPDNKQT